MFFHFRHLQHPVSFALISGNIRVRSLLSVNTAEKPLPLMQPMTAMCAARTLKIRRTAVHCVDRTSWKWRTSDITCRSTLLSNQPLHRLLLPVCLLNTVPTILVDSNYYLCFISLAIIYLTYWNHYFINVLIYALTMYICYKYIQNLQSFQLYALSGKRAENMTFL